jgi:AraC-like DNA-binding protein
LHYVTEGNGKFFREGKEYSLKKGDLFVIPPFLETYYKADSTSPWSYIWIGFTAGKSASFPFESPVIHCPEAKHVFEEMKLCVQKEKGKTEFLVAKLWELISILTPEDEPKKSYVEIAIQFMKNEYMNAISISEIADRLGLDRSYFTNLFKAQIGVPPGKYLLNLRLSNAAELMTKHDTSPTTAALSCGFTDIYHFSKAFKNQFGISPRAYKNQKKTPL